MPNTDYNWNRYWFPRGGTIRLHDSGYMYPPDAEWGHIYNPNLVSFDDISTKPCLALLGEPGLGKTHTVKAAYKAGKVRIEAAGEQALWLDLRAFGTDVGLINGLFGSELFLSWLEGGYRLHLFLDSLDECRLRVESV